MIKSLALVVGFLGVLPFLLGLLYSGFVDEEKDNVLFHMAAGYIIMFGLFEILALPLLWMRQPLSVLTGLYCGILFLAAAASLAIHFRRLWGIFLGAVRAVREFTLCIWAQFLLIGMQAYVYLRYQYTNTDDAFFVASATTSLATDTIFAFNPYTGAAYKNLPSRYVLSPFHAFTAVVSKVTDTHPAIVAHVVFMIAFLLLSYAVYALLGRALFAHDLEKTGYFLVILSGLHVFSAYSERTEGLFLLIRLWQGKAVLAGILLPMILYLCIRIFLLEGKWADWLLLVFLMLACCLVSSMGIMLGAIMLGLLGILFAFRRKSLRLLICVAACCLPNLICAGIYLVIR